MTLIKQLWIAIVVIMALAFGGSLVLNVLSSRHYLEQQLQVKNIDNATALALSLSQLPKDPVMIELQIAAQFDAGHYRFIRITSPSGQVMVERVFKGELQGAPLWFTRLIPISARPGLAQIQDGWKQYGSLSLASHEQYAYQSLWQGSLELLLWFVLGSLLTGIAATLAMRLITRPLDEVVKQAKAIEERHFLHIEEPRTPELRSVVRAMNSMVERLKAMFGEEASRLETLRQKINLDALTGLYGREHFRSQLGELINGEDYGGHGSLVLLRLKSLDQLNADLGHPLTNGMLKQLALVFKDCADRNAGWLTGRLRGGDFALACPSISSPREAATALQQRITEEWLPDWIGVVPDLYHLSAVGYQRGQSLSELMSRADEALAFAQAQGPNSLHVSELETQLPTYSGDEWRKRLSNVVNSRQLQLAYFPVKNISQSALLHQEGVLRWQLDAVASPLRAGDFMPIAAHLNLSAPIDLQVVRLALDFLRNSPGDLAINLSAQTISDFSFRHELLLLLQANTALCSRLMFEVPEYGVYQQYDAFYDLVHSLKPLGCRLGIEYFSESFSQGHKLADLRLDYIKVHPSYMHQLQTNPGNQEFLKGLCVVSRLLGITVIALGVEASSELTLLAELGFDGATGPGIK
ncbi:MAG: LapD/MoxY N-terminal periplasmic domain-containing protein [Burkholderiaceae bacterium]